MDAISRHIGLWTTATLLAASLGSGLAVAETASPSGPTLDGIASNCNAWHTVVLGDSCQSLEKTFKITAAEFLAWNPAVSKDCKTNFWTGYCYCVGIDPHHSATTTSKTSKTTKTTKTTSKTSKTAETSTSTKSGVTSTSHNTTSLHSSTPISNVSTPYSTRYPITSYNLTAPYTATAVPPQHTLSGQPSYCNSWRQVTAGDTCQGIVNLYKRRLTMEKLLAYNPTIGEDCSGLFVGWYICVDIQSQNSSRIGWYTTQTNFTEPAPTDYPGYTATVVANFTASPQQTGIPSTCQNFYQAKADDTCSTILAEYSYVTKEQFLRWNPALQGNCQGLWVGYYYCVANFDSSDLPMPPTVTVDASPIATGIISTCRKWYKTVVSDDCASVAAWFGTFSESDFITWNPSVGRDCSAIEQDTYYCVGLADTPTTRSNALSTTKIASQPIQTGIAGNCTQYWLVSGTDTCDSIVHDSGVAKASFYVWNPAVGSNCTGLAANYYVCVGTGRRSTIAPTSIVTITPGISSSHATNATSATHSTKTDTATKAS